MKGGGGKWVEYLPKALATSPGQLQPPSWKERKQLYTESQVNSFFLLVHQLWETEDALYWSPSIIINMRNF